MTSEQVKTIVARELDGFVYQTPFPGTTVGVPWSAEKVARYREALRGRLVEPAPVRLELRETYAQVAAAAATFADVWIVAEAAGYLIFFDPAGDEFGLAEPSKDGAKYVSIGVRGDLVGVYCAA